MLVVCFPQGLKEQNYTMSQRSEGVGSGARRRPLHFTEAEVNRIVSLFDVARYIDVGSAYNDRLRVMSHVHKLNFNLGVLCYNEQVDFVVEKFI